MAGYLARVCSDPRHPAFLPGAGYHQRMGMPNPDTAYQTAAIDGAGTYRLTGDLGTSPDVSLMPMGGPTAAGLKTYPAIDLASSNSTPMAASTLCFRPSGRRAIPASGARSRPTCAA